MQSLQDTLYNWLTIKVVCDARPEDSSANDTRVLFENLLNEEHQIEIIGVKREEPFYFVQYCINQEEKTQRFPIELIEVMLDQINAEPEKYLNYD
ncbi:hypothetical protein ELQ35_08205 [Peribacillus cavernae]|uniref:Uncharacterized protein n=1 Tax=Peribacillus cavernae TaxID=1674310 RepID=A0A3S0W8Z2_9BACI|nr:hypothetical protein [Peribacillus cavernae]MDQ0217218.1 hypothetical protein [Peribacillus cavernae]RUQ30311.1 hypothetical protein ELQ35_08205 [Peribacillus cavernae]